MRILFLTQWFQPESFFKGLPFARALKNKGHEVEVLTGFPNYPGGKIYPGYKVQLYKKEMMDGITVHRVPLYPSHDKSALRRIINYLSFSLSAFLMGPWLIKKPDVIYVYNLVTLGPAAYLLRLLYGAKVIIDVQDLWPQSVADSGMLENKIVLNILNGFCNRVYNKADLLTVLSPGFKNHLAGRKIDERKIHVIYNWCNESAIGNTNMKAVCEDNESKKLTVLYAGAMGVVQGLDSVLECAKMCMDNMPDVRFTLIGEGADRKRLERLAAEMSLRNVTFLPRRPIEKMAEIYDKADVLLVHLKDYPLFRITIPSKTQAYLYMGKPIVIAVHGDAAALVEEAGAGIVCTPDQPSAMMEAIKKLYEAGPQTRQRMGRAGHDYYMRRLSFDKGADQFESLMSAMVKQ